MGVSARLARSGLGWYLITLAGTPTGKVLGETGEGGLCQEGHEALGCVL